MNYFTEISNRIKTACSSSGVLSAVGTISGDWATYHVFDGGRSYVHGQNRGRVPYVTYWRVGSEYSFDAVSTDDQGGSLTSTWILEIITGKSSQSDENDNEEYAYAIAQKILKAIRAENNMSIGSERIREIEPHPFGYALTVELTINNTYMDSNK